MNNFKRLSSKDTSIIDFVLGIGLMIIGLYAILKNTSVGISWASKLFGTGLPSGIVTLPIIVGIVIVILNRKSKLGWTLMGIGIILLLITIICSVRIIFHTTSLGSFLIMFGGTLGGIVLLLRALLK